MENKIEITYLSVDAIKPYSNNARKHTDADVDTIANSILAFGFDDPIGIWGEENLIVEGHGRLLAAKKLGMTEVPCIRLDHLSDEQRRAYALAHNKTAELSAWDWSFLDEELDSIIDIDMSSLGFSDIGAQDKLLDEFFDDGGGRKEKEPEEEQPETFALLISFDNEEQMIECQKKLINDGYKTQRI